MGLAQSRPAGAHEGQSKQPSPKPKRGHYALICNVPAHYKDGMYADFTVQ